MNRKKNRKVAWKRPINSAPPLIDLDFGTFAIVEIAPPSSHKNLKDLVIVSLTFSLFALCPLL